MNFISKHKMFAYFSEWFLRYGLICYGKINRRLQEKLLYFRRLTIPLSRASIAFLPFEKTNEMEELRKTIRRAIIYIETEDLIMAEKTLETAFKIAIVIQRPDILIKLYELMGNIALKSNDYKKAKALFLKQLHLYYQKENLNTNEIVKLYLLSKIARTSLLQGDKMNAREEFKLVVSKIEENLDSSSDFDMQELLAITKKRLGELQMDMGQYAEARKSLLDAYNKFEQLFGKKNIETLNILQDLSIVCRKVADYSGAIKHLEEAIALAKKEFKKDAEIALMEIELGMVYLKLNLIAKARELCTEALKLSQKSGNEVAIKKANACLESIKERPK